jgi:response regulator RpfG family c-di-GMP phosphodiesterase
MVSKCSLNGKVSEMFIFYVDANPIIIKWLEKAATQTQVRIYTAKSLTESAFVIDDLKPDVLIIDGKLWKEQKEEFEQQLKHYPLVAAIPLITVGEEIGPIKNLSHLGHIAKPLQAEHFLQQVASLWKTHQNQQ